MQAMDVKPRNPAMWLVIGAILLAPLIAMQFTKEVNWTARDFGSAAVLLGGAAFAWEVAQRRVSCRACLAVLGVGLVLAVLLVWAEGAVGLF